MCTALAKEHVATKIETGYAETEGALPWKNEVTLLPAAALH